MGRCCQCGIIASRARTVICYWAADESGDFLADLFRPAVEGERQDDGGKVGELLHSLWRGRALDPLDPTRFYAVTLSGAQGRAIVRDWFETTVGQLQQNLAAHFSALDIAPLTLPAKGKALPPVIPLRTLLESLAVGGKSENIPAPLAVDFLRAALSGRPYPPAVFQLALRRTRAEIGKDSWLDSFRYDARIALLKAVLSRQNPQLNLTRTMDPKNEEVGYLLGRMFALLERFQQLALGYSINSTIVDRYLAVASARPQSVFTTLLRNRERHEKKALREKKPAALATRRDFYEVEQLLNPKLDGEGFPQTLSLQQQGLFMLGFHHQRAQRRPAKELGNVETADSIPQTEPSNV